MTAIGFGGSTATLERSPGILLRNEDPGDLLAGAVPGLGRLLIWVETLLEVVYLKVWVKLLFCGGFWF